MFSETPRRTTLRLILALTFGASASAGQATSTSGNLEAPTPGRLLVAPKDRWVVAHAYANSATFREAVDQLRSRPSVVVRLESVPAWEIAPASAFGVTRWAELPRVTRRGSRPIFAGVVNCRARMAGVRDLAARFAHELAHAEELARYGSIARAPGVRASHDDRSAAETDNAISIGLRVRQELAQVPVVGDAAFALQLLGPERLFRDWTLAALVALTASPPSVVASRGAATPRGVSPDRASGPLAGARDTSD